MLFVETIKSWKGPNAPTATSVLLNTNRIGLLQVEPTNDSKYYYTMNLYDRREKPHLIVGDTIVANIIVAMDDVLDSNAMLLKVFPDDDPTATPVNKYIDYADFAYAFNGESAGTSWVHYYSKGFKQHRVLVDHTIAQLESLAESGATA
jgi:hypothetical protein